MKILILIMTNKNGFYEIQGEKLKYSLQEVINNKNLQDIFSVYTYIGDSKKQYLDKKTNTIYLHSSDQYHYMYIKTIEAFEFIKDNKFKYDFLVRINASEFINIQLLYELCKIIKQDDKLYQKSYTSKLLSFNCNICTSFAPYPGYPLLQGKFMMFSKETVEKIIENKYIFYDKQYPNAGFIVSHDVGGTGNSIAHVDDICIGSVLNIINSKKSFEEYYSNVLNLENINNSLIFDDIKDYVTIALKDDNNPTELQLHLMEYIKNLFINNVNDNIQNSIQKNLNIINKPTIYCIYNKKCDDSTIEYKHGFFYLNDLSKLYK